MKKKRGVLSLWLTIVLVFAGMLGIAGVTVLAVYLTGGFNKPVVEPDSIVFSTEIDDGLGQFDNNQFEVSSNFQMKIITTKEGVTETDVTLSMTNGNPVTGRPGYITDGVIIIPQKVKLNTNFLVELSTASINENGFNIDWVKGGFSTIYAQSSIPTVERTSCNIAVDVPVHPTSGLKISVTNSNQSTEEQNVVVGTSFYIESTFLPAASKNTFSSQNEKYVFFSQNATGLEHRAEWEYNRYRATTVTGSGNPSVITAYTFANSHYQKEFLAENRNLTDYNDLSDAFFRYMRNHPNYASRFVSDTIRIRVVDVDIDEVKIGKDVALTLNVDKYFRLTANSPAPAGTENYASLGASITDYYGLSVDSLFGNIGIKIPTEVDALSIKGGRVIAVVDNGNGKFTVNQPKDLSREDMTEVNVSYYLLSNNTPYFYKDYFWQFSTEGLFEAQDLKVNFFQENAKGEWEAFFKFENEVLEEGVEKDGEMKIRISSKTHSDTAPTWVDDDVTVNMTINYDESGKATTDTLDLSEVLNKAPADNVYRTVKFFLLDSTGTLDLTEYFMCKPKQTYTTDFYGNPLTIGGATETLRGNYELYEISTEHILTAKKSLPQRGVQIVALLVRTDADGKIYYETDGKYQIVNYSRAKNVNVTSTPSIKNMNPKFTISQDITPITNATTGNKEYYIPAINRQQGGEDEGRIVNYVINFSMLFENLEDLTSDPKKIIDAYNRGKTTTEQGSQPWLKVVCVDASGKQYDENYVTLSSIDEARIEVNETDKTAKYSGIFAINETLFAAKENGLDNGTYIALEMQYYNGKNLYKKSLTLDSNDDTVVKDYFYIYYQQPNSMQMSAVTKQGVNVNQTMNVKITTEKGVSITWGGRTITGANGDTSLEAVLKALNEDYLSFTLLDKFGKEVESTTGYKVEFVEIPDATTGEKLLTFNDSLTAIGNFKATGDKIKTTRLAVYVLDRSNNRVHFYTEEGGRQIDNGELVSPIITMDIESEGLTQVKYDSEPLPNNPSKWDVATNMSSVTINKYVTGSTKDEAGNNVNGTEIDLHNLLQIYTSGQDDPVTNYKVTLDENFLTDSQDQADLMKMINFYTPDNTSLASYQDVLNESDLSRMQFLHPFKEDTRLVFWVSDGMLFNIQLTFWCKQDISMAPNFKQYYTASDYKYNDYLVSNADYPNADAVFAGGEFDLDKYLTLNSSELDVIYEWKDIIPRMDFADVADLDNIFSIEAKTVDGVATYVLKISSNIYQYRTASFTIYYGVKSKFAPSQTITLYINPNIVVREILTENEAIDDNPFVNIENNGINADIQLPHNIFQIYRLTDYIEKGETFDGCTVLPQSALSYTYGYIPSEDVAQYLTISKTNNALNNYQYGFAMNGGVAQEIDLKYGQKLSQNFYIYDTSDTQRTGIQATKIKQIVDVSIDEATNKVIFGSTLSSKVEKGSAESIQLTIDFGLNKTKDTSILKDLDTVDGSTLTDTNWTTAKYAKTVTFVNEKGESETYMLLKPNTNGYRAVNFNVIAGSQKGYLTYFLNALHVQNDAPFVSTTGNSFGVETTIFDNANGTGSSIKVSMNVSVIISGYGDASVLYFNKETWADGKVSNISEIPFNTGDGEDEANLTPFNTIIGDWAGLQSANVYQVMTAGRTYDVVHDIAELKKANTLPELTDAYGFYYDKASLEQLGITNFTTKLSIVRQTVNGLSVDNLATVDKGSVKINHLEEGQKDAYIILKLELAESGQELGGRSFEWYYRIKVAPNFSKGEVTYPFPGYGEYLGPDSDYYFGNNVYLIPIEDEFTYGLSSYNSGNRFGKLSFTANDPTKGENPAELTTGYRIVKVTKGTTNIPVSSMDYPDYFSDFRVVKGNGDKNNINIKIKTNVELTIYINQYTMIDGVELVGSEKEYLLKFNQQNIYLPTITRDDEGGEITGSGKLFATSIVQDSEATFTTDIKVVQTNGSRTSIYNYDTFISPIDDADLSVLKQKAYIKQGAILYTNINGTEQKGTAEYSIFAKNWSDSAETYSGIVTFEATDGNTYYANSKDIAFTYAPLETVVDGRNVSKHLSIKVADDIKQDHRFRIGFYTDQTVVFELRVTATSDYTYTLDETELVGGNKYNYLTTSDKAGIFKKILHNAEESTTPSIYIKLTNGDDSLANIESSTLVMNNIRISDLVLVNNLTQTLEFANLLADTTFEFDVYVGETVSESADGTMTYDFVFPISLTVKKSFSFPAETFINTVHQYGGRPFTITLDDAVGTKPKETLEKFFNLSIANSLNGSYSLIAGGDEENPVIKVASIEVTPNSYSDDGHLERITTPIGYYFGADEGKIIYAFMANYQYSIYKSVTVTANYPNPDSAKENKRDCEYIGTIKSSTIEDAWTTPNLRNFFVNSASLADKEENSTEGKSRISIKNVEGLTNVKRVYTVAVSNISENVTLTVTGGRINQVTIASEDKTLLSNAEVVDGEDPFENLEFRFALKEDGVNPTGMVEFSIIVNAVETIYKVIIVQGEIVKLETKAPNYGAGDSAYESVYVEDLNRYLAREGGTTNLFENGRIASYQLNSNETADSYYIRMTKGSVVEAVEIDGGAGRIINFDLGKSYADYNYEGTFATEDDAKTNQRRLDGETSAFYIKPLEITERVRAVYYDGTVLTGRDDLRVVRLAENNNNIIGNIGNYEFTTENYKNGTTKFRLAAELSIKDVSLGDMTETYGIIDYFVKLSTEFDVLGKANNAKSLDGLPIAEIKAGETKSLLSYSEFGFVNPRYYGTSKYGYTVDLMKQSAGYIGLGIYGLGDLSAEDTYSEAYKNIDALLKEPNALGLAYGTGLNPRIIGTSSADNFLWYYGVTESKGAVDYNIQGLNANNDGNHVMLKLTYFVKLGTDTIEESFDILFKVMPDITIQFQSTFGGTTYNPVTDVEIVDGQSVATNKSSPMIITTTSETLILNLRNAVKVTKESMTEAEYSSRNYTFTYQKGLKVNGSQIIYNNYLQFEKQNAILNSGNIFDCNQVKVPVTNMGTKYICIDFSDRYGYKGRFYFQIRSSGVDPQFSNTSVLELTEGETFAFGLDYKNVNVPISGGAQVYDTFAYQENVNNVTKTYNTVLISPVADVLVTSAKLLTTYDGIQYEKTLVTSKDGTTPSGAGYTVWAKTDTVASVDVDKDWKDPSIKEDKEQPGLSAQNLIDSSGIEVRVAYKSKDEGQKAQFVTVSKKPSDGGGSLPLTQTYTVNDSVVSPILQGVDKTINLTGIDAFAFDDKLTAITKNSIVKENATPLVSKLEHVKVTEVKFTPLSVENEYNAAESGKSGDNGFYTNSGISFVSNSSLTALLSTVDELKLVGGNKFTFNKDNSSESSRYFTVPTFAGILYGTGDVISEVRMEVTLQSITKDVADVETQTISRIVRIKKESVQVMKSTTIIDGNSPEKNISGVLNDTLELKLEAGQSVDIAIKTPGQTEFTNYKTYSNNKPYAVTEYIGISSSIPELTQNLTNNSGFNFSIKNNKMDGKDYSVQPIVRYNGLNSTLTKVGDTYQGSRTIDSYAPESSKSMILNIENIAEMPAGYKSVRLYFLYKTSVKEGAETYQYADNFRIYPSFRTMNITRKEVSDYYTVTNGTSTYYVLDTFHWADTVILKNITETSESAGTSIDNINKYKLHFEIDAGSSYGGAAYIDEKGVITTTESYNPNNDGIAVTIYSNISGSDGMFGDQFRTMTESQKNLLKIGTITLSLNPKDLGTDYKEGNNIYYNQKNDKDYHLITVPRGYKIYGNNLPENEIKFLGGYAYYACQVGEIVDFRDMLTDINTDYINKNYHVVSIDSNYIYAVNNLNKWSFDTAGYHTVFLACTGLDANGTYKEPSMFSVTMVVYSPTAEERYERVVASNTKKVDGKDVYYTTYNLENIDSNVDKWFMFTENGGLEAVSGKIVEVEGLGNQEMRFIAETGSNSKIVSVNFYTYFGTQTKNVAWTSSNYALSNLIPKDKPEGVTYSFYRYKEGNNVISVTNTVEQGFGIAGDKTITDYTYLVVGRNTDGSVASCESWNVNYHLYATTASNVLTIPRENVGTDSEVSGITFDAFKNAIVNELKISNTQGLVIYERDITTGILTEIKDSIKTGDSNRFSKYLLVKYNRGTESEPSWTFAYTQATVYTYDKLAGKDTVSVDIVTTSDRQYLTRNLNEYVKEALISANLATSDDVISDINYFEISNLSRAVENFELIKNTTKDFYISATVTKDVKEGDETKKVSTTYYIKMQFNLYCVISNTFYVEQKVDTIGSDGETFTIATSNLQSSVDKTLNIKETDNCTFEYYTTKKADTAGRLTKVSSVSGNIVDGHANIQAYVVVTKTDGKTTTKTMHCFNFTISKTEA